MIFLVGLFYLILVYSIKNQSFMQFNLSPNSNTDTFSNESLSHPLSIGNEFMPHPINQLSEEAQNDFEIIGQFAKSHGWVDSVDFEKHLKRGSNAVVISDANQTILYVSSGFEHMTGYSEIFARGKKAKFLQGEKTESDVIHTIQKAVEQRKFVECVLTNYRKNGELYLCKVKIFPMFNDKNELVNFVALESEVYS
jgi:PAS domain S-box-containing protein